jgi:hypothetical protein
MVRVTHPAGISMNNIFLSNQVIVYLLSEAILLLLMGVAFVVTVGILRRWDFGSFSQRQFALERRAYLVMTILLFVFVVKFFLVVYFVFAIDNLAVLVPGAMCAAGVISANDYGMNLLFIKLLILFFLLLWMAFNRYDLEAKNYPIFRVKSWLFIVIFILVLGEGWLDMAYFSQIDLRAPVSCCSALFGQLEGANPLPFGLDISKLLGLFYLLYFVVVGSLWFRQRVVTILGTLLFIMIAYYSVVYFFGTYVYELPTHKCPFCMMQPEYHFIGYVIWGSLFIGAFLALVWATMGLYLGADRVNERKSALGLLSLFVLVCTAYVASYYMKNGVLL